jgi:hypothetical protein
VTAELRLRDWKDLGLQAGSKPAFHKSQITKNNAGKITANL